jgi:hypothetical protein
MSTVRACHADQGGIASTGPAGTPILSRANIAGAAGTDRVSEFVTQIPVLGTGLSPGRHHHSCAVAMFSVWIS